MGAGAIFLTYLACSALFSAALCFGIHRLKSLQNTGDGEANGDWPHIPSDFPIINEGRN